MSTLGIGPSTLPCMLHSPNRPELSGAPSGLPWLQGHSFGPLASLPCCGEVPSAGATDGEQTILDLTMCRPSKYYIYVAIIIAHSFVTMYNAEWRHWGVHGLHPWTRRSLWPPGQKCWPCLDMPRVPWASPGRCESDDQRGAQSAEARWRNRYNGNGSNYRSVPPGTLLTVKYEGWRVSLVHLWLNIVVTLYLPPP